MKIKVAGAGAGKTTKMADLITGFCIPEGKIVFCIAFTNAAAHNIANKVADKKGTIPKNIKISTIHSFLYQELVNPFYYFLYGKQFECLSVISLPDNDKYKRARLKELENENILHFTQIPEKAKWVAYKKSGDNKTIKDIRKNTLRYFSEYCAAIFVDEAQDISVDIMHVLEALDQAGIEIILYGDPKQDVKGYGCFKRIIDKTKDVQYVSECYRCPQKHLKLSNMLAADEQQQVADKRNAIGSISIVFESEIDSIQQFINEGNFGLKYISRKRDRFETHEKQDDRKRFDTLYYEVLRAMTDKWESKRTEIEIKQASFYVVEQMLEAFDNGCDSSRIVSKWIKNNAFDTLSKQRYAQMISAFFTQDIVHNDVPVVHSIEIVKGLEAERCLFILTTDVAPYLFGKRKEDNKTSHLLYVALTRSLDHMTIFVTKEVESEVTRPKIMSFFNSVNIEDNAEF